jgi:aspartate/methionine/tyrosine aminotransferase
VEPPGLQNPWRVAGFSVQPGTSIAPEELQRIHEFVHAQGGVTMIDEIYLGLSYSNAPATARWACPESWANVISINNSFSKYFNMTDWRPAGSWCPSAIPRSEWRKTCLFVPAPSLSMRAGWFVSSQKVWLSTSAAAQN